MVSHCTPSATALARPAAATRAKGSGRPGGGRPLPGLDARAGGPSRHFEDLVVARAAIAAALRTPASRDRRSRGHQAFMGRGACPSPAPGAAQEVEPVVVAEAGDQAVAVAGLAHGADERLQAGGVAELARDQRAVEVGAERDAALAEPRDQVVEVARAAWQRRVGDPAAVARAGRRPRSSARRGRRWRRSLELGVGQVARGRAQRVGVRVGGDQRRPADRRHVGEAGGVEVREIDEDPQPVAGAHQLLAGRREPRALSGLAGKRNGMPVPKTFGRDQTGPSERSPAACSTSSSSRSGPIASAPSRCRTAAIAPAASRAPRCRRRWCRAGSRRGGRGPCGSGWRPSRRWPGGPSRRRSGRAAGGRRRRRRRARRRRAARLGGDVTAKSPPERPPARARGRSRCPSRSPSRKRRPSRSPARQRRISVSLCPSKTRCMSPALPTRGSRVGGEGTTAARACQTGRRRRGPPAPRPGAAGGSRRPRRGASPRARGRPRGRRRHAGRGGGEADAGEEQQVAGRRQQGAARRAGRAAGRARAPAGSRPGALRRRGRRRCFRSVRGRPRP